MGIPRPSGSRFAGRIPAVDLERGAIPDRVRTAIGPGGGTAEPTSSYTTVSRLAATAYSLALGGSQAFTPGGILALQRTVGNAAVNRLLTQVQASRWSRRGRGTSADEEHAAVTAPAAGHGQSGIFISRAKTKQTGGKNTSKINNPPKFKKAKKGKNWHGKSPDPTKAYIVNQMLVRNDRDTSAFAVDFDMVDSTTGYGSGMNAIIGDWNHLPTGSPPSVKPPGYPTGDPFFTNYMVQGHLLNDNLGGPGNDLANLAPISKTANSEHLHKIEAFVKSDVIHKGEERHYNVIVLPPPPNPAHFPSLATGPSGAMHPYFYKLPAGLQCEIFESNLDGSPGKVLYQHTVTNKE